MWGIRLNFSQAALVLPRGEFDEAESADRPAVRACHEICLDSSFMADSRVSRTLFPKRLSVAGDYALEDYPRMLSGFRVSTKPMIKGVFKFAGYCVLTIILSLFVPVARPDGMWGDASFYSAMASHPLKFTHGRWGFRLLTPLIVHFFPPRIPISFYCVTIFGLGGTAWSLAEICQLAGLKTRSSVAAGVLFLISFGSTFCMFDRGLIDPLTFFGTAVFFLLVQKEMVGQTIICAAITTLNKEWGIFLIAPFLAWRILESFRQRRFLWKDMFAGTAIPLGVFYIVRHWPGFGTGQYVDSLAVVWDDFKGGKVDYPFTAIVSAFGVLPFLMPLGWKRAPLAVQLGILVFPGVFLQFADAGLYAHDQVRMISYAFLPVVLLAIFALDGVAPTSWAVSIILLAVSLFSPFFPGIVQLPGAYQGADRPWLSHLYRLYRDTGEPDLTRWLVDPWHLHMIFEICAIILCLWIFDPGTSPAKEE
jgi:hypothetical protein